MWCQRYVDYHGMFQNVLGNGTRRKEKEENKWSLKYPWRQSWHQTLSLSSCVNRVIVVQNLQTPWTTLYAWDISHAFANTYHPYCHSPSALTEYLKAKLRAQHAKCLSRSLPAQVEQNVPLERNTHPLIRAHVLLQFDLADTIPSHYLLPCMTSA